MNIQQFKEQQEVLSNEEAFYLKINNQESIFITRYLQEMNDYYLKNTTDQEKVIDFIAGMTDEYLISSYENLYCK